RGSKSAFSSRADSRFPSPPASRRPTRAAFWSRYSISARIQPGLDGTSRENCTQLKNRIHATLAKYALHDLEVSDFFGVRGRALGGRRCGRLPPHTAYASRQLLAQVEELGRQVGALEKRIQVTFKPMPAIQRLLTLPGVGFTLAVVIALEVGDVARFASAEKLAGYAGTTPRVHASGGKTRFGPSRPDVNRYLKWAFVEAANVICFHR